MQIVTSLLAGLLFGIGLILSGMTDPEKIIGFLDVSGNWNPSLMMVMIAALLPSVLAFTYAKRSERSWLGLPVHLPEARRIDRRLVLGSLVFGAGWGLAGYCPGPALSSILSGRLEPLIFVMAMLAGMAAYELIESRN
ncbi:hypothetical protein MTYP_01593 [Methylophilaceae bacterium]|nr:hypothetical protein MTYP_01593 [Methylophilaceae bacterium]